LGAKEIGSRRRDDGSEPCNNGVGVELGGVTARGLLELDAHAARVLGRVEKR
jgi:hypothetical protein